MYPEGSILMLKKQDIGINLHVANNGSRDQSLTGIGGPQVYVQPSHTIPNKQNGLRCARHLFQIDTKYRYMIDIDIYRNIRKHRG